MSAPAIALQHVSKTLGTHPALIDVSLEVAEGAALVILGASGCGKTTLLRVVAGLETPDVGTVGLHGTTVAGSGRTLVPPHRRGLGFVFQDLALWPHLTVAAHLRFVLDSQHAPKSTHASAVDEALRLVHIERLAKRYPHELSGGEQQRAALARALVVRPRILLLDEPFSSVDAILRQTLRTELTRLREELRITMVCVTHDADDAEIATRTVRMQAGRLTSP
jgi:ABC-type Fe3+/spermidine/putrescine transport system ATPase subunit